MNPLSNRIRSILLQSVAPVSRSAIRLVSSFLLLASPTAQAIVDVNNNGVSDLWEKQYNDGQRFTIFDPEADPDGDGWSNAQEAAAGTDPFDANPPNGYLQPEIAYYPVVYQTDPLTNITETISPAAVSLNWPTLPGKQYTLLYSTDLAPGSWTPLDEPRIGTGWDMGNGITLTQQDGSMAGRIFWRVAVTDPIPAIDTDSDSLSDYEEYLAGSDPVISDSDGDTLSDYAELIAGTNPNHADEDGDGWTDPQEIAAGTTSNNQDTDGDSIPDSLDSQPLVSIQIFADADGDGIPDPTDPDPDNPRGLKPFLFSENASGNPQCELEMDETSSFIFTVSNPAGPPPTLSDLKLYLNGDEELANITALTTPPSAVGTQRFLLSWTAKVTTGYPEQTLQNLSLRFRDAQNATTWLNLARIDVAEWEGMIAGIGDNGINLPNFPVVNVVSHHKGVKQKAEHLVRESVRSVWYRGPKAVQLLDASGSNIGATAQIGSERYPLFIISKSGSSHVVEHVLDISDPVVFPHDGKFYVNRWSTGITMSPSAVGNIGIPAGGIRFQGFPPAPETGTPNFGVTGESYIDDEYRTIYSNVWTLSEPNLPYRNFNGLIFYSWTDSEDELRRDHSGIGGIAADIGATITPHSVGTPEYPGLPISPPSFPPAPFNNWPGRIPLLPIQSEQWHKIVLKVGPDAGALSNGITLKFGTGEEGENAPQSGFSLQVKNSNSFTPLPLPGNGEIEMLPSSELYQKLTSPEGLTLFLQRDATVSESHRMGLDLIPKKSTYLVQRVAALDLPPLDVEQQDYDPAKGIRFCRWLDAFQGVTFDNEFANRDRDRFRIKIQKIIPNLTKIKIKTVAIHGALIGGAWVGKTTDGDYELEMKQENGAMVSTCVLLVGDGDDDVVYNGKGTDDKRDDQTLLADFDSRVIVTFPELGDVQTVLHAQKAVGVVTLDTVYLSPAGDVPPIKLEAITRHIGKAKEIYRQIGIRVDASPTRGEAVPQSWFDAVPATGEPADRLNDSECFAARNIVRSTVAPAKHVRIGYVDATLRVNSDLHIPTSVLGFTLLGTDGIVISLETNAQRFLGTTAHEVGHALDLDHTPSPLKTFLMHDGLPDWENDKRDSKRFQEGDFNIIKQKDAFYVPL